MEYILTENGADLLTKLTTNKNSLHLSQAKTGSGYSNNPEYLTDVVDEKNSVQIADATVEDSTAVLTVLINNEGLTEEYKIKQLGIFAIDDETGNELLFIIGQDLSGDKIPKESDGRVEYRYVVRLKVSSTTNVVVDVNDTDFVLKKTFNAAITDINKKFSEISPIISDAGNLEEFTASGVAVSKGQHVIVAGTEYTLIKDDYTDPSSYSSGHILSDEFKTVIDGADANGKTAASQNAVANAYNMLNAEIKFKVSSTVITDDDSTITKTYSDGSKSIIEISSADGVDTVTEKQYDSSGILKITYTTKITNENTITETEVH